MTTHTPGPWTVREGGRIEHSSPFYPPGVIATVTDPIHRQATADARLIAAAPDLLVAAEDALSGWRYIRSAHGEGYGVAWDRVENSLKAAIAKATGGDA